jgi:hypothetical protein
VLAALSIDVGELALGQLVALLGIELSHDGPPDCLPDRCARMERAVARNSI